jgi:hypothetical protein
MESQIIPLCGLQFEVLLWNLCAEGTIKKGSFVIVRRDEVVAPHRIWSETRKTEVNQTMWKCHLHQKLANHRAKRCQNGQIPELVGVKKAFCGCGTNCTIVRAKGGEEKIADFSNLCEPLVLWNAFFAKIQRQDGKRVKSPPRTHQMQTIVFPVTLFNDHRVSGWPRFWAYSSV